MLQGFAVLSAASKPQPGCVMHALPFCASVVAVMRQAPQGVRCAEAPSPPGHQLLLGHASHKVDRLEGA